MAEILGKVTGTIEVPRGADVSLRIAVPRLWLVEGRSIEVELPRNLTCANCQGGGCGKCSNSGAITLRGRGELPEMIQVALPEQCRVDVAKTTPVSELAPRVARAVTIRIPECGGLPESGSGTNVRGWLLLDVAVAADASTNVRLLDDEDPLSSSKMLHAEVRRESSAEPSSNETEVVLVARGSMRSPARRSGKSSRAAEAIDESLVSVQLSAKPRLLDTLASSKFVRRSLGMVVAAVLVAWMWYWR